jgi:hypothetical protein
MRTIIGATVLVLFATTAASAQPVAADPTAAQIQRGKTKMWIGVGLVGAGLAIILLTVLPARPSEVRDTPAMWSGLGLTAVGSGLIFWGAQERAKRCRSRRRRLV